MGDDGRQPRGRGRGRLGRFVCVHLVLWMVVLAAAPAGGEGAAGAVAEGGAVTGVARRLLVTKGGAQWDSGTDSLLKTLHKERAGQQHLVQVPDKARHPRPGASPLLGTQRRVRQETENPSRVHSI